MSKQTTTDFEEKAKEIRNGFHSKMMSWGRQDAEEWYITQLKSAVSELVEECKPNVKCIDKTIEGFAKSFVDEYEANLKEALGQEKSANDSEKGESR